MLEKKMKTNKFLQLFLTRTTSLRLRTRFFGVYRVNKKNSHLCVTCGRTTVPRGLNNPGGLFYHRFFSWYGGLCDLRHERGNTVQAERVGRLGWSATSIASVTSDGVLTNKIDFGHTLCSLLMSRHMLYSNELAAPVMTFKHYNHNLA